MGSIKDRIQNAIRKSQNDRYNREGLDDLGGLNIHIAQSNIKDAEIERAEKTEEEEDLGRAERRYQPQFIEPLPEATGDYKINIRDIKKKPLPKVLTDEERYAMDYIVVDKRKNKQTGWDIK